MKHRFGQQICWTILFAAIRPFMRLIVGYRWRRAKRIHGPAILLCNHNLDIDVGLLGLSYAQSMRVVASEHLFRLGVLTFLIRLFFAPIARMKGKTEIRTVRDILGEISAGGRVCIFPEGNRSYNGVTGEITRATASLVRMAKCQLITYRIEGGYFKHPRWARKGRRGPVSGREVGRYPAEQLWAMNVDEVLALIQRDLQEDAYARQAEHPARYTGKRLAESIETALYLCPRCGAIGSLHSKDDQFVCSCGLRMRYTETGILENAGEGDAPFSTVTAWDRWQESQTAALAAAAGSGCITQDEPLSLYRITPRKREELMETGALSLSKSTLICGSFLFPVEEISDLAIIAINTLVFETRNGEYYEIRSKSPYSALKYRRLFLHLKKIAKGECGASVGDARTNV